MGENGCVGRDFDTTEGPHQDMARIEVEDEFRPDRVFAAHHSQQECFRENQAAAHGTSDGGWTHAGQYPGVANVMASRILQQRMYAERSGAMHVFVTTARKGEHAIISNEAVENAGLHVGHA